jgi:preprotein translocase subunit YajC
MEYLFPLLILLLFIPIFLSGRRQRRSMQQMQQLQSSLAPGDEVMTTSGLRATVVDTSSEETVDLEIAPGITTTWMRAAVREKVNPDGHSAADLDVEDDEVDNEYATEESVTDELASDAAKDPAEAKDAHSNGTPGARS